METLRHECRDPQAIRDRLAPLIAEILDLSLRSPQSPSREVLARELESLIRTAYQKDPEGLAKTLRPLISPAIGQEIAENREKMVDTLYPILGGMITRYVSHAIRDLLETINRKIEDRFSTAAFKRKIKAKLTGVSESELLLEESLQTRILSIFIIHKESGLLIAESNWGDTEIEDPHMVASMASAIKDFINDWIQNTQEVSEVQLVSYGNASLYIESAGSVYLIAFLNQEPDSEEREAIRNFFADLLREYAEFFQRFDGDSSAPQIPEIETRINRFIQESNETVQSTVDPNATARETHGKHFALFAGVAALIVLVFWGAYRFERAHTLDELTRTVSMRTHETVHLSYHDGAVVAEGTLLDPRHRNAIIQIIQNRLHLPIRDQMHVSAETWSKLLKSLKALQIETQNGITAQKRQLQKDAQRSHEFQEAWTEQTRKLQHALETSRHTQQQLRQELQTLQHRFENLQWHIRLPRTIRSALQSTFGNDPGFHPEDGSLDIFDPQLLQSGDPRPNPKALAHIKKKIEKYITILLRFIPDPELLDRIEIVGYTDSRGDPVKNRQLSLQRAQAIRDALLDLPIIRKHRLSSKLIAVGEGGRDPIIIEGRERPELSRRIRIGFRLTPVASDIPSHKGK